MSWPDHIFAGGVPGQGVPGVLQGGGDLREQLLQGVPRPRDHDPLPHLRGDVHSNHLPSPGLKVEFRTNIFPKNWIISKQISICACMWVVFWNSHLAFPWGLGGNMVWVGRARNPICGGAGPGGSQCAQPLQIWHKFWGMRVKMVTMVTRYQRGTQWWWDASHQSPWWQDACFSKVLNDDEMRVTGKLEVLGLLQQELDVGEVLREDGTTSPHEV